MIVLVINMNHKRKPRDNLGSNQRGWSWELDSRAENKWGFFCSGTPTTRFLHCTQDQRMLDQCALLYFVIKFSDYKKGRDRILEKLKRMSSLGVGVSPGNVPVYHGGNLKEIDRRVRLAELTLRCLVCGLALLSSLLTGTDTQVREIFTIRKRAKFTDMKALVFLVIVNGIAAAYSLLQVLRCVLSLVKGTVMYSKPFAWVVFSGDQLLAYLTLSAVAANIQSGIFAQYGQTELQWMKTCTLFAKFCNRSGEGVASSLLACIFMVVLSGVSAYRLFRLYGGSRGKSSGGGW